MFDGGSVPEQLRRFIASPLPQPQPPPPPPQPAAAAARGLPFPLSFPSFEPTYHFLSSVLGNNNHKIIHHHNHHHDDIKDGGISGWMGPTDEHSCRMDHDDDDHHQHHHPWSSDEVLALLRLRSTVENWFPGFTWEHISRKLTEVGFKRTPEECKEKFEEEERRYFNNNSTNDHINDYNNSKGNIRMFSELEELYHHGHHDHHHEHHDDDDDEHVSSEVGHSENKRQKSLEEPRSQEKDKMGRDLEEDPREEDEEEDMRINPSDEGKSGNMETNGKPSSLELLSSSSSGMAMMMMMTDKKKKRKRKKEREGFEMLKGFCEGLVRNMIAQQEEMHKKILEDMVKRDEENIAREEAWKKQEMERINKELEIRAHEQALASDRNSTIIKFITKFTSLSDQDHHQQQQHGNKVQSPSTSQSSSSLVLPQTPSSNIPTLSSSRTLTSQNHFSLHTNDKSLEPTSVQTLKTKTQNPKPPKSDEKCDIGKRWPRDEVLALVNIRCSISAKNGYHHHEDQHHNKDGLSSSSSSSSSKAIPLWERISKKMMELGYKRSAKRCKEKWENINKYFRKTKDVNKKRPLDSRTCPYFHQLSALYGQGPLTAAGKGDSGGQDPGSQPEETRVGSSNDGPGNDPSMRVAANGDDNEKNTVQAPGFDFEF